MEELAVINNDAINEYVRVTVYKYWEKDGEKAVDLDPSLINLHFVTGAWVIDEEASPSERPVLYYIPEQWHRGIPLPSSRIRLRSQHRLCPPSTQAQPPTSRAW